VSIKLTASDNIPGGFTPEEAVTVARSLVMWDIDAIEVSSGTVDSGEEGPARRNIDSPVREAYNAPYAKRIKAEVKVPVIWGNGSRFPNSAAASARRWSPARGGSRGGRPDPHRGKRRPAAEALLLVLRRAATFPIVNAFGDLPRDI
jgi:hypothetical protein